MKIKCVIPRKTFLPGIKIHFMKITGRSMHLFCFFFNSVQRKVWFRKVLITQNKTKPGGGVIQ